MDDYDLPAEKSEEGEEPQAEQPYLPYLKQELQLHVVCDTSVYTSRGAFPPMLWHYFHTENTLGLHAPIVYLSDFWVLMRDLVRMDKESIDRIRRVRDGEKQEGDDKMTEKDIEKLNFDGKLRLTWDNWSLTHLIY